MRTMCRGVAKWAGAVIAPWAVLFAALKSGALGAEGSGTTCFRYGNIRR